MCFSFKASISNFALIAIVSLFLFYRNTEYDRAIAVFSMAFALIQAIEAGVHAGANPQQAGQLLYLALWLQPIILSIGVYVYITSSNGESSYNTVVTQFALWTMIAFAIVFVLAIINSFSSGNNFHASIGESGHIEWKNGDMNFLGDYGWLYLVGIFLPLIIIFAHLEFADIGIAVLILYGVLSAAYVLATYPSSAFTSLWCYYAIGFVFLAWFMEIAKVAHNNRC